MSCALKHKVENRDHELRPMYWQPELAYILRKVQTYREMVRLEAAALIESKALRDLA